MKKKCCMHIWTNCDVYMTLLYRAQNDCSAFLSLSRCPNPEDGTVEVLQNGVSTSSHFSFRVFTFADLPHKHIYLHCVVHLCLIESGNCMLVNFPTVTLELSYAMLLYIKDSCNITLTSLWLSLSLFLFVRHIMELSRPHSADFYNSAEITIWFGFVFN